MGKLVAFGPARTRKDHERKEAKAKKLQNSFRASRQMDVSKSKSTERLKQLFKGRPDNKK